LHPVSHTSDRVFSLFAVMQLYFVVDEAPFSQMLQRTKRSRPAFQYTTKAEKHAVRWCTQSYHLTVNIVRRTICQSQMSKLAWRHTRRNILCNL